MDPLLISPNIDVNAVRSSIEGSANEVKGAIQSKALNVQTLATSLSGPELFASNFTSFFRTTLSRIVGAPPFPNPLEPYASVNYIWTLSCLTVDELNRPDSTYRRYGPKKIICRSGGSGAQKVKTATELALGGVEFYIDDVEVNTVITHNKGTKQADAINGSFKIFEPYSMGLFYETLQIAALSCGYKNYIDAPFMLTLHFKGYDDNGNVSQVPGTTRYFPIHIINSTFNVTEQGSTYDVAYVKHNDQGFGDNQQAAKNDLNLSGSTVQELLQTGGKSLTSILNERLLKGKEAKQVSKTDQYIIMFPKERSSAKEAILGKPSEAATGATTSTPAEGEVKDLSQERKQEIFESIAGIQAGDVPKKFDETINKLLGITIQRSEVGETIRKYAENPENINSIGQAKIVKSKNDTGTKPQTEPNVATMNNGVVCRAKCQVPETLRTFQFKAGTKVQDIIEEIVIASEYGRGLKQRLKNTDKNNMVDWFKIESQVFESNDSATVDSTGKNPKVFLFRVVPYKVNAARFNSPSKVTPKIEELKLQAAKEYNYIYTGKNKDILDFDIQFNNAFFVGIGAQRGQASKDSKTGSQGAAVSKDKEAPNKQNEGDAKTLPAEGIAKVSEKAKKTVAPAGGGGQEWSETQVARQFNEALLDSPVDLIKVDLKIWGDPFWLNDSGAGNYTAEQTEFINITKDGSADFQSSEIDCVLNFRTPFDLNENGFMQFNGKTIPTKAFSGLYQCIGVASEFSGGKFEQTLKLIRRRNQEEPKKAESPAQAKKTTKGIKIDNPQQAAKSDNSLYIEGGEENQIDHGGS